MDTEERDADSSQEGDFAAVLDRTEIRGVEWIRVQIGSSRTDYRATYVWVPRVADVIREDQTVHVDPVYEPATLACPSEKPSVTGVAVMLPALALECYGAETLTFDPVQVRRMWAEDGEFVTAEPEWLALESDLWLFDAHEGGLTNSIGLHVDPQSGLDVPVDQWLEIEVQIDHSAAATCRRTSDHPLYALENAEEALLWCREQFVVSAFRVLPPSEQPPTPMPPPTPGPPTTRTIDFTTEDVTGPLSPRFDASAVWTGTEVIVWGGIENYEESDVRRSDGAAYDPLRDDWRAIAKAPLEEREGHLAVWTGTEMLIWGGHRSNYIAPPDGAGYDPATNGWREMAAAPVVWTTNSGSVWTGTEWVIVTTDRDGTEIAAYDPRLDSWRMLPLVDDSFDGGTSLAWTGDEIVLSSLSGMYRLGAGDDAWHQPEPYGQGIYGSIAWSGDQVIGIAREFRGVDSGPRYWGYLTAWDPALDSWSDLPQPPLSVSNAQIVWTGDRAVLLGSGLVFDVGSGDWWTMGNTVGGVPREGAVTLWAGDRLFVWGGGEGHPPDPFPKGYVLIPEW